MDTTNILDIQNRTYTFCLYDSNGNFNNNFTHYANLGFQPDFAVVKAINFNSLQAVSANLYLIKSNLNDNFIGTFYPQTATDCRTSSTNNRVILLKKPIDLITFGMYQVNTTSGNSVGTPTQMAALTSLATLTVEIDFIQVKNKGKGLHDNISHTDY